jgi:hypothetical protein
MPDVPLASLPDWLKQAQALQSGYVPLASALGGERDNLDASVRTNSPLFVQPETAPLSSLLERRASPAEQWESAIEEQHQRDLRKPSMPEQILDIAGKGALMPAELMAAPLISLAQKSHDNLYGGPHAIPKPPMTDETYGDPKAEAAYAEALKRYHGGTFMDLAGVAGGIAGPRVVAGTSGTDTTLGMFFAAPKAAKAEAEKMLAAGVDAKGVWNKLGVFQGKDGQWRK